MPRGLHVARQAQPNPPARGPVRQFRELITAGRRCVPLPSGRRTEPSIAVPAWPCRMADVRGRTVPGFSLGPLECRVVPDGVATYDPQSLYSDLRPEETGPAVRPLLNDQGLLRVPYHPPVVRTADGPALIDAGASRSRRAWLPRAGLALAEPLGAPVGQLDAALTAAGVAADDIGLAGLGPTKSV